ncbi:MAG: septal ring lytic transglycosylase RlpA family protein [Nitrospirae bacterium]|nr:septal ring lytic transglycosylase RlpA family protein [Nitrospirota bacterium]
MKTSADISFRGTLTFCLMLFLSLMTACGGVRYDGKEKAGYAVASWYGPGFHGKLTASGETYDMYSMTCAHKSLPFGTRLRITNVSNSMSVDVTVNDRGPFVSGRDIDLSYSAAKAIGLIGTGTGKIKVEYIGRDSGYIKQVGFSKSFTAKEGPYTIQVGSFKDEENASRLKDSLELKYKGVYITTATIEGQKHYRVRVGKFQTKHRALRNAQVLAEEGYSILITNYDEEI